MKNNQKTTLVYFSIVMYLFISCRVKKKVRIPLEGNYCNWELLIDEEDIDFLSKERNKCSNKIYLRFKYFPSKDKIVKDSLIIICDSKKINNSKMNDYFILRMEMENKNIECKTKSEYITYSVPLIFKGQNPPQIDI
tara:strand:+ start:100 stop:510 length:411 start_codon:yes stop_codon:yes gene_type:complete